MTITQAQEIVGTLSKPSKMPCFSTSIPAKDCLTGSKLREVKGSICSGCYAMKGFYMFPSPKKALQKRLDALNHPQWVESMAFLINVNEASGFFRWFDSGDIQSVNHLANIVKVCLNTPQITHWLPTKEYGIVTEYIEAGGTIPSNLTIRLSAYMLNTDGPTAIAKRLGVTTSTVTTDKEKVTCKAPDQLGKCLTCRACWNKEVPNIAYKKH